MRWAAAMAVAMGMGFLGLGEGFGAGYSGAAFLFWDLAELNAALEAVGYPPVGGPLVLYGGMGIGGDDLRFGGGGFGGSRSAGAGERRTELSMGLGGASGEILVLEGGGFSATVGAFLGGGGAELRLRSRAYGSLGDALAAPADLYLSRGFFLFLPFVSVEFWPLDWFGVRVTAGNLLAFPGPWRADGIEFTGPPETFGGPFFSVLVAFGGRGSTGPQGG
ncbi:MAG: hypothetical protein GXO72_03475 [Caldiserica bacterium]|nr:hypothetical protein [Caldisericota bacterium]